MHTTLITSQDKRRGDTLSSLPPPRLRPHHKTPPLLPPPQPRRQKTVEALASSIAPGTTRFVAYLVACFEGKFLLVQTNEESRKPLA